VCYADASLLIHRESEGGWLGKHVSLELGRGGTHVTGSVHGHTLVGGNSDRLVGIGLKGWVDHILFELVIRKKQTAITMYFPPMKLLCMFRTVNVHFWYSRRSFRQIWPSE
jgi:hypothetical protein